MKNAMKRIMSLALVVMLLISAVPFALAATKTVDYVVKYVDCDHTKPGSLGSMDEDAPFTANSILATAKVNNAFVRMNWGQGLETTTASDLVKAGAVKRTVSVRVAGDCGATHEAGKPENPKPEDDFGTINVNVKNAAGKTLESFPYEMTQETTTANNILKYVLTGKYQAPSKVVLTAGPNADNTKDIGGNGAITGGNTVWIVAEAVATKPEDPKPEDPKPEAPKPEDNKPAVVESIKVVVKVNESDNVVKEFTKVPSNDEYALVENLLTYCWNSDWEGTFTFHHAWVSGRGNVGQSDKVYAGETLYIMLNDSRVEDKEETILPPGTTNPTTSGTYYNAGYKDIYNYNPYEVYLNIYLNGDVNTIHKIVKITKTAAKDGKVTLGEVQEIVKDKYDALDSDGIFYTGLYLADGNWIGKFSTATDRYDTIDGLLTERKYHTVNINVMIDNAKVASSGTADSSNPKTGDNIMIAVTTMALAGAALVAVTELKKRKMI